MRLPPASDDLDDDGAEPAAGREPLDPGRLRVETKGLIVEALLRRVRDGAIDLLPALRRPGGLGRDEAASQLVESLLVRIPLATFWIDATDDNRWLVMDGVQRLGVLERFVIAQSLTLSALQYVPAYAGMSFAALPRAMQRRIEETPVQVCFVQPGMPPELRVDLWRRICGGGGGAATDGAGGGGSGRSAQEIRHALAGGSDGRASAWLGRLAATPAFVAATAGALAEARMADRQWVLAFLARGDDGGPGRLLRAMARLNDAPEAELAAGEARLERALAAAQALLGEAAFAPAGVPDRARFLAWTGALDALDDADLARLVARKDMLAAPPAHADAAAVSALLQQVLA
jgi:hypothetical protein